GSAIKAASRRLRRWPSASLDCLRPPAPHAAVIERHKPLPTGKPAFNSRRGSRISCREPRAGWMVTVPPFGRHKTADLVDGSHPRGFLTACMRNVRTDPCGPTGYEVIP